MYAVNFLWAPLIDRLRVPWLTGKLGHRRAWIVTLQSVILICMVGWSMIDPKASLWGVIAIGLVIAIASATQDITIDALRIEQIGESEGNAPCPPARRSPSSGGGPASSSGAWSRWLRRNRCSRPEHPLQDYWQATFLVLGSIVIIWPTVALMFVPEPQPAARAAAQAEADRLIAARLGPPGLGTRTIAWITGTVVGPLMSFFRRNGFAIALAVLGFVFLFKIGEAFLGRMSIIFYKEIGFTKTDIALYSKGLGWFTTVAFTLLGGLMAIRIGLVKAMFVSGAAMALTNLMFSVLAWSGKSEILFATAVLLDDLTGAFATVTFVAFISMLVDRTYTATQYALLASIGTAGRTVFAGSSGALVDWLDGDWGTFFVITTLMVIPSLVCLWLIRHKLNAMLAGPCGSGFSARRLNRSPAGAANPPPDAVSRGLGALSALNNRAENSQQPFRRREGAMARFKSEGTLQKFTSIHASVHNHFNHQRHLNRRDIVKQARAAALAEWRQLAA